MTTKRQSAVSIREALWRTRSAQGRTAMKALAEAAGALHEDRVELEKFRGERTACPPVRLRVVGSVRM